MGNVDNGVEIGGNAQNIVIGGPQPTFNIIPQNAISPTAATAWPSSARRTNNIVNHSYIGTDIFGAAGARKRRGGRVLGSGTYGNTIGSTDPALLTVISGNLGNGIEMRGTHDNTVVGSYIGIEARRHDGRAATGQRRPHHGGSYDNVIGSDRRRTEANIIAYNTPMACSSTRAAATRFSGIRSTPTRSSASIWRPVPI